MKKAIITLALSLLALILVSPTAYSAGNTVKENPDIKIIVDGNLGKYTNPPIISNGRTLLPMVEILTNLGIQNNGKNILWDGKEKSIAITKDSIKIYLKIGSKTAYVNDKAVTIDAAPMIYKGKTYIPASFVAQSLNKKVVWHSNSSTIYIRDEKEFNRIKDILNKAIESTKNVKKYKCEEVEKTTNKFGNEKEYSYTSKTLHDLDKDNKIKHETYRTQHNNGDILETEYYYFNNSEYKKFDKAEKWTKTIYDESEYELFFNSTNAENIIGINDYVCAGLIADEDLNTRVLTLKGNVCFLEPANESNSYTVSQAYAEIQIDKETNVINKLLIKLTATFSPLSPDKLYSSYESTYTYSEFNGNFEVIPPKVNEADIERVVNATSIPLTEAEKSTISTLKSKAQLIPIDGMWDNPYELGSSEAIMFILLKDKADLEAFKSLSDIAKKVLMNDSVQENYGDFIGCETVYAMIVFEAKAYAELQTGYEYNAKDLELHNYDEGEETYVVVQDKDNNTYSDYYEN
ncbi:MAG: copper amine oxidase N-terminal domain-containing protein [Clostridia bacterium]|nr:copper amine oxidase N-terminal domain-containing protein [Clostridia bacterium]